MKPTRYSGKANGKLLLTGEYLVLQSALALAFPAQRGQTLEVDLQEKPGVLDWVSKEAGDEWFTASFTLPEFELIGSSDETLGFRLKQLLHTIRSLSPTFLKDERLGFRVITDLNFPRNWGLGTSSTLLSLLADWAGVSAYDLLEKTFGGSGYDIACADREHPIFYRRQGSMIEVSETDFHPPYIDRLFLGFSGIKQDSGQEVKRFSEKGVIDKEIISRISEISKNIIEARDLRDFNQLIREHEQIMSKLLGMPAAGDQFRDMPITVKSLGAWGGDFLLFTWDDDPRELEILMQKHSIGPLYSFSDLLYL